MFWLGACAIFLVSAPPSHLSAFLHAKQGRGVFLSSVCLRRWAASPAKTMRERRRDGRWTAALVVALLAVSASSQQYSRTIVVDPERGNNTEGCLTSPDLPCRNLSYAFQYQASSTRYLLLPGTHYLNTTTSFTDLTDIAVTGNASSPGSVKITCFAGDASLSFIGIRNVALANVTISECGTIQNSTSQNFSSSHFALSLTRVAVYFNSCENLVVENIEVSRSRRASGVTIYNTNGTNRFLNCNFSSNSGDIADPYPGGGGVYVEFSYCLPGVNSCEDGKLDGYTDRNRNSLYSFRQCIFSDNHALTSVTGDSTPTFIVPHKQDHVAFGRGGGLSVFFNANATGNQFTIADCTFSKNKAKYGAGLFVEFHDTSAGNRVVVNGNTHFVENDCDQVAGGGMRVAHYVFGSSGRGNGNRVEIHGAHFLNNTAGSGGGLSISPSLQNSPDSETLFSVVVNGTEFISNHAPYGAAVRIDLFSLIVAGKKPNVTISNCFFYQNTVYPPYTKPLEVGLGAVYISAVDVYLISSIFLYNFGSALAQVASSVYFLGSSEFAINRGIDGGGIALLGSSRIIIERGTRLVFWNNSANRGGAIFNRYADKNDYKNSPQCFIAHSDPFINPNQWDAVFRFVGNTDARGPNSVYSTSILPCALSGGTTQEEVRQILCWNNWTYNGSKDCSQHIRTGPGFIERESTSRFSPVGLGQEHNKVYTTAYSGQYIPLYFRAFDDLNHSMLVAYSATVTNSSSPSYVGAKVDPYYTYVTQNTLRVYQYTYRGTSVIVNLDEVGDRAWHIEINIELDSCPPGLLPTNISCDSGGSEDSEDLCITCQCHADASYNEALRCSTNYSASLARGFWMGDAPGRNETEYVASECPPGFCRSSGSEFSPLPEKDLDGYICGPRHRTGVLCGECVDGYGVALNSDTYECVPCNVSNHQLAVHATY